MSAHQTTCEPIPKTYADGPSFHIIARVLVSDLLRTDLYLISGCPEGV